MVKKLKKNEKTKNMNAHVHDYYMLRILREFLSQKDFHLNNN